MPATRIASQPAASTALLPSVPPLVKTTSAGLAPTRAATCSRASSMMARARRPSACGEDGLPTTSSAAIIAARASRRSGAVAFQSRYVRAPAHSLGDPMGGPMGRGPKGGAEGCRLARTVCLAAGMPSITSCSVTLSRKAAICSPSASHKTVRQAALAGHAGLGRLAAAARHADVLLDRGHDLGDADGARRPTEAVAAQPSARALDQPGTSQFEEELLQVGERGLLALGNHRQGQRAVGAVLGEIRHGRDRIPAARVQLHDACLQITLRLAKFDCTCARHPCPCYETRPCRPVRGTRAQQRKRPSALSNCSKSNRIYGNSERVSQVYLLLARILRMAGTRVPTTAPAVTLIESAKKHARAHHQAGPPGVSRRAITTKPPPTAPSRSSCIPTRSSGAR